MSNVCAYCFTPLPKDCRNTVFCSDACDKRDRVWDRHIETTRKTLARGEHVEKVKAMPGFTATALVINRFVRSGGALTSSTYKENATMAARKTPAEKVTVIPVVVPPKKAPAAPKAPTPIRPAAPTGERYSVVECQHGIAGTFFVVVDHVETRAVFVTLHKVKAGKRALYCNENKAAA